MLFEYDSLWLDQQCELSPFALPNRSGIIEHSDYAFGPLPGLFDDSLPDGWGLLLMDRHFRKIGFKSPSITPLHRLAYLGSRTMGALTYHPSICEEGEGPSLFDLHELASAAQDTYAGKVEDVLPQLLRSGGSPGGAKPKVLTGYNAKTGEVIAGELDIPQGFEHWLVKFVAREDRAESGLVEYAYSKMAAAAGLQVPPTRLFETVEGDAFFGVQRFDRGLGNLRRHVHTFGNLIETNFRIPSCDYSDLLKATAILTRDRGDTLLALRQMTFNVLAHNRDDHAKNFAFILDTESKAWSLSPAYDLTFAQGPGGEHTMTVQGEGKSPSLEQMTAVALEADISPREYEAILEEVRAAIGRWPEFARSAGVSATVREEISSLLPGV